MTLVRLLFYFTGRINRAKFWLGFLIAKLVLFLGPIALSFLLAKAGLSVFHYVALLIVPYIWIILAISVKRLHDMDTRGWWIIAFAAIPIALNAAGELSKIPALAGLGLLLSFGALLILGAMSGTEGDNRFGPDPLERKKVI